MKPIDTVAVAGVTAIELNVAAVTVKVAEPDLPPNAAVIVAVPTDSPVAMPVDTTVATRGLPEVQRTVDADVNDADDQSKCPLQRKVG